MSEVTEERVEYVATKFSIPESEARRMLENNLARMEADDE